MLAELPHPFGRPVCQFRMVLILPSPGSVAKSLALATNHDLATGHFGEKRTSASLADQFVDIGNQIDREDDVCSAMQYLRHTPSVTYYFVLTWKGLKSL
jgi:hypothetical protein